MICKYCSENIPDSAQKCPECGKALKTVIISRHSMPPQEQPKCVSREDIYNVINKAAENKAQDELKHKLIVYGIVIAVSAGVLVIWALIRLFFLH